MEELQEVKALKNLLGSLFSRNKTVHVKTQNVSPGQVEKVSRALIEKILDEFDAKTKKIERKKSAEGVVLRYHTSIGSQHFVLKCYAVFESRYFNLTLWSADSQTLKDVLAIGDIRQQYRLIAMGKIRLTPWAKGEK